MYTSQELCYFYATQPFDSITFQYVMEVKTKCKTLVEHSCMCDLFYNF